VSNITDQSVLIIVRSKLVLKAWLLRTLRWCHLKAGDASSRQLRRRDTLWSENSSIRFSGLGESQTGVRLQPTTV